MRFCNGLSDRSVCALLGVAAESVHYFGDYFGLIKVLVLTLGIAAERSVHYFWNYLSTFLLLSGSPNLIKANKK